MRFERFDLNLLVSLDALLSEQSVTRAAQRVFLSQSAMSWTLGRLRKHFGDPLLVSVGRKMVLTPFARELIRPVQESLLNSRNLLARRPVMSLGDVERRLRIVASDHIAVTLLADVFRDAESEAPGLSLDVRGIDGYASDMMDKGNVDLLIGARAIISDRHPSEPLLDDGLLGVVCNRNRAIGTTISFDDYCRAAHVSTRWRDGHRPTLDQTTLRKLGIERCEQIVVPDFTLVPSFVIGTGRIATLPGRFAHLLTHQWPLRTVEIEVEFPRLQLHLQWPSHLSDDPVLAWLRARLIDMAHPDAKAAPPPARIRAV